MCTNDLVAMLAAVLVIVASGNAEWDEAASEPAAEKGEYNAEDPGKGTLWLIDGGDTGLAAELAGDLLGLIAEVHGSGDNNLGLGWASSERLLLHRLFNFYIIILRIILRYLIYYQINIGR